MFVGSGFSKTVACGSASRAPPRNFCAQDFRESPIHHQDFSERPDHDVCRLQIAVQHTARVRKRNGVTNAEKNSQTVRKGRDQLNIFVEPISLHKFMV